MKEPTRLCTSCRNSFLKKQLIRVVRNDNELVIDQKKIMDGRGAYICKNENCIKLAHKRHSLERSLKVDNADNIYAQLEQCLQD